MQRRYRGVSPTKVARTRELMPSAPTSSFVRTTTGAPDDPSLNTAATPPCSESTWCGEKTVCRIVVLSHATWEVQNEQTSRQRTSTAANGPCRWCAKLQTLVEAASIWQSMQCGRKEAHSPRHDLWYVPLHVVQMMKRSKETHNTLITRQTMQSTWLEMAPL